MASDNTLPLRDDAEYIRQLASKIYQRWSIPKGGSVEPFFELFHDDATFTSMAAYEYSPKLAGTQTKQQFKDFLYARTRTDSTKLAIRGITADEGRLAVEAVSDMTIGGHHYRNTFHHIFEIRDGKISRCRLYYDTALANAVLGLEETDKKEKSHVNN